MKTSVEINKITFFKELICEWHNDFSLFFSKKFEKMNIKLKKKIVTNLSKQVDCWT